MDNNQISYSSQPLLAIGYPSRVVPNCLWVVISIASTSSGASNGSFLTRWPTAFYADSKETRVYFGKKNKCSNIHDDRKQRNSQYFNLFYVYFFTFDFFFIENELEKLELNLR